jgi:8-oxo-dGTP diphosphatase
MLNSRGADRQGDKMTSEAVIKDKMVIAAVIERNGRFLVCQRPSEKAYGALWEFPGGKVEPGETLYEAAQRELSEELGLKVTAVGEVRIKIPDPTSGFEVNFVDVQVDGDPRLLEHIALNWITPDGLLDLPMAPSDRKFVEHLNESGSDIE